MFWIDGEKLTKDEYLKARAKEEYERIAKRAGVKAHWSDEISDALVDLPDSLLVELVEVILKEKQQARETLALAMVEARARGEKAGERVAALRSLYVEEIPEDEARG